MNDMQHALDSVEQALTQIKPPQPQQAYMPQDSDNGVQAMAMTGDLSSRAFRDAADECAKRILDSVSAVLARAAEIEEMGNRLADEMRRIGDDYAKEITKFSQLTQDVARTFASTKEWISRAGREQ